MDILMVSHLIGSFDKGDNDRFKYLANLLVEDGHSVELVTSDFEHHKKKYRGTYDENLFPFKTTMLHEPSYKRNISIKRIYCHYSFSRRIKEYLEKRKIPDVIYCSIPPLKTAVVVSNFVKKNKIKFIIDVQDLWPEGFKIAFNVPVIKNILFAPMMIQANTAYRAADEIVAVSKTYADRALRVNKKCTDVHSVYLGTDLRLFDEFVSNSVIDKPRDEVWLAYIGNIGYSYDFTCVMEALVILKKNGINNIKFIVMGDGQLKSKFKEYAKANNIYSEFTGRLDYGKMVSLLSACDIAVNPIIKASAGSIVNKVGDYAAAGLPVINTQESEEYRKIVEEYNIGFNCENGNSEDMAKKIQCLYENIELRKTMGRNNRKLAEDKFDRNITYREIVSVMTER